SLHPFFIKNPPSLLPNLSDTFLFPQLSPIKPSISSYFRPTSPNRPITPNIYNKKGCPKIGQPLLYNLYGSYVPVWLTRSHYFTPCIIA
ncbi:hypothetical protein, partial [Capnocytophaga sp. oral taxon 380]|uniref:hypothetical protein n=1 Tax=Capnocytophaga sp. oral taxon 380 TaxID=712217 RepID=UPI001E607DC5